MSGQRAWLIDASIYIFRAYFSLPERWHTADGQPLNAVYGYASFLIEFLGRTGGSRYCAAAFDESLGSCFRNEIMSGYKSSRVLPDEDLAFQLETCRELTEVLGIACYGGARYEADDYIATLASRFGQREVPVTVVTRDKDLGQVLAGAEDRWWDFAGDIELDSEGFYERFEVHPHQFADYLALVGDTVDDIPGVPGVGPKTAVALLKHYGNLEALGRELHTVGGLAVRGASKLQDRLEGSWEQALVSRQLALLASDIPEVTDCAPFELCSRRVKDFASYLEDLGINGPLPGRARRMQQEAESAR